MSPPARLLPAPMRSFPRVSGDEPLKSTLHDGDEEFSPRERG